MTSISWLSIYLQLESEFELMNNISPSSSSSSTTNVTPSHNDRCIKKRRLSNSTFSKSSFNSEFLKTSVLTNIHRTSMFTQTFSSIIRVNIYLIKLYIFIFSSVNRFMFTRY